MRCYPVIAVFCCLFIGFIAPVFGQTTTVRPPTIYGVVGAGTVELGQRVTLSVSMEIQTGIAYQYQWRKSSVDIPGATQATYVIEAAAAADAGTYTVRVSNSAGESAASGNISVRPAAAPIISTPPRSTSAQVGQTVTFTYVATGSYPRTHQWSKDGSPIPGATAATLELANITTASVGSYTVVISNSLGSVTSSAALLTVNAATPLILSSSSPSNGTYTEGTAVDIFVSIQSGSSPYTYQWFKDGNPVEDATATSNPLRFTAITPAQAGTYSVRVGNILGSVTSRNATITVTPATPVTINSQPRAVAVFEGESANFSVSASGTSPRYQWYKDDVAIAGATSSSYYISEVRSADVGSYSVAVSNIKGSVTSSPALLTIKAPVAPTITTQPIDRDVTEGNSTSFSVVVAGSPTIRYQWYFNGTPLASSATSSTYSLTPTLIQAGDYHVVVTNPAGSVTSRTAKLGVTPRPPPPVVRLSNVTATLGSSFSISTYFGSSSGTTTFQWYKNGAPIADATRDSYSVSSTKPEDAGDYVVVITNSSGSTTSRVARVTVVQPSGAQTGAWVGAARSGNIVYFAFANPARVERFDIVNERWLTALPLPRAPAAFAVGPGGIYTAAGSIVYRYTLEGAGETILNSAFATNVVGLVLWRDFLLVSSVGYRLTSLRLADGATVASRAYSYYWGANMAVTTSGQAFSRTAGISPSDIVTTTVQADGSLGVSSTDSRYHGDYPDASRVFVSPDDRYVADDGGTVYTATGLVFAGGLGGRLDDLVFTSAGLPVILRGGSLFVFNESFTESGRATVGVPASRIFLQGEAIHAFAYPVSGGSVQHVKVPLSQVARPAAAAPIDASTLGFTPDATFVDRDGVLLLFSRLHRQIFRWSPSARRYLAPVTLQGWPDYVTYAPSTHRLYLGYSDARVLQVKLDAGSLSEEPFVTVPQEVLGLAMAGDNVFVVDPSGAWVSYFTYSPEGRLLAQRDWSYLGSEYAWNAALGRMYQFRDDTSPNDLLYTEVRPNGTFGQQKDSPFHGEIQTTYPIRISPDGSSVLLGTGKFYDANTMMPNNSLANRLDDAAWVGGRVYTGRLVVGGTEIQRWGGNNYALDLSKQLSGRLVRMFALPENRLVVVTLRSGAITYTVFDANLAEVSSDSVGASNRLINLAARAMVGRGDQMLIPGFVVSGAQPKRLLIRAAGPALAGFGVSGSLADPTMSVLDSRGAVVAANDNWSGAANAADVASVTTKVGAFAFAPGSRDAAALISLPPGAYTVQTSGAGDTTGVSLVEIYDAQDEGSTSRLVNLAARARVGVGADVLIPGFVVQGSAPKTLLVRAVGPGLAAFGVEGTLADPRLRIYRGEQLLHENDNWQQSSTADQVVAAGALVGAFALPAGSRDAALLVTLPPGAYTAQISGVDGGSGVALVEVYEVNN